MYFHKLIADIEKYIPLSSKYNENISKRGVDWHLDHILKVLNSICIAAQNSNPNDYSPKFSLYKSFILFSGYMPRGKGRSPKSLNNLEQIKLDDLLRQFEWAKSHLSQLENLSSKHHFKHPLFGHLNKEQTKRFIKVHSHHHLKIIKDIIEKS